MYEDILGLKQYGTDAKDYDLTQQENDICTAKENHVSRKDICFC